MANKGSPFEREVCTRLSLWWTQDLDEPRDDIFWRTAGSGGRATNRRKKGKDTSNSCGDICCLDSIGEPLLRCVAIEIKRGYSGHTIADLLDKPRKAAEQLYEKWITQAETSQINAKAASWLIISRRDRRDAIVIMPYELTQWLGLSGITPFLMLDRHEYALACYKFTDFLNNVDSKSFAALDKRLHLI